MAARFCRRPIPRRSRARAAFLAASAALALVSCTDARIAPPRAAMTIVGHGPVVVFESGTGEAQESWAQVRAALAPCLTVVTYDRPGGGARAAPGPPASPVLAARVADDLLAELRAHGLSAPYILVGHSIGGLYVQAFARNHPAAVAGLVLVDASSPLEPPGVFVSKRPPKPGSVEAAEEAGVGPSVAALLAGPALPSVPLVVLAATDHDDTEAHETMWRDVQRRMAALSPQGRLVIVAGGHDIQTGHPAAVAGAVLTIAAEAGDDIAACRR